MSLERQSEVESSFRFNETFLIRWLTSTLGDPDAARDVAQTTFIRVWMYAKENEIKSPKTLIFKTAARLALDELRRRRRFFRRNIFAEDMAFVSGQREPKAHALSPEDGTALKQEAVLTLKTIESLPPKVRMAFILHRFEGLNYQQIAARMDVSKSSVEKYMMEALRQVRAALAPRSPKRGDAARPTPLE